MIFHAHGIYRGFIVKGLFFTSPKIKFNANFTPTLIQQNSHPPAILCVTHFVSHSLFINVSVHLTFIRFEDSPCASSFHTLTGAALNPASATFAFLQFSHWEDWHPQLDLWAPFIMIQKWQVFPTSLISTSLYQTSAVSTCFHERVRHRRRSCSGAVWDPPERCSQSSPSSLWGNSGDGDSPGPRTESSTRQGQRLDQD